MKKYQRIENEIRDGITLKYVAKKYKVDLEELTVWWNKKQIEKRMFSLVNTVMIESVKKPKTHIKRNKQEENMEDGQENGEKNKKEEL